MSKVSNLVATISSFRGLKNPSTICYGNSAIQMLSKIPLFRNGFDGHCESGESCGDLHKELKEVFDSLAAPLVSHLFFGQLVIDGHIFQVVRFHGRQLSGQSTWGIQMASLPSDGLQSATSLLKISADNVYNFRVISCLFVFWS